MLNWARMDIQPGMVVWRGVKIWNISIFKLGVVEKVNPERTAKIHWRIRNTGDWTYTRVPDHVKSRLGDWIGSVIDSHGTCTIDSLVPVDVDLDDLLRIAGEQLGAIRYERNHATINIP